jgi:hypothetical protein
MAPPRGLGLGQGRYRIATTYDDRDQWLNCT